jgi:hypothetical protein
LAVHFRNWLWRSFACVLAAGTVGLPAQAQFAAIKAVVDLGAVPANRPLRHSFTIRNAGITPLAITRVEADCGLAIVEQPQGLVQPGHRAEITVEIEMTDRTADALLRTLLVHSPANRQPLLLSLRATPSDRSLPDVRFPDTIGTLAFSGRREALGGVLSNGTAEARFQVRNFGPVAVSLPSVLVGSPALRVVPSASSVAPGQEATLRLIVFPDALPEAPSATGQTSFLLRARWQPTPGPQAGIELALSGYVEWVRSRAERANGPQVVVAAPDRSVGRVRPAQASQADFVVTNTGKAPLTLGAGRSAGGQLQAAGLPATIAPGDAMRLAVQLLPSQTVGARHRTLAIPTNDPGTPEILLHVRCVVMP